MTRWILVFVLGCVVAAQAPKLEFEAASVRAFPPGEQVGGITRPVGSVFTADGVTARQLVHYAFDIVPLLRGDPASVGGPAWVDSERFTINARSAGAMSLEDSRRMLQTLLADRFALRYRKETREVPAYALTVARRDGKLGPGLRRSAVDCSAYSATLARTGQRAQALKDGPQCGLTAAGGPGGVSLRGTDVLADLLMLIVRDPSVGRPVIDRTGLSETFEFEMQWDRVPPREGAGAGANIFAALEGQLGLKLEPARVSKDVVTIDHIERPRPD